MQRKFGTFAGVFTPSILTILGVIMYMRLGWVVGQAGILGAIGVILTAHIISVTTGLSISSISTDKKIKTGGIYYILSRSLGLPIGGSIGITLFVGTALSIALYIIGFCENFLGIESINEFLGIGSSINSYRILGTAVVIILVIIAYISTSVALKTQFFILTAIILSIISIVVGILIGTTPDPEETLLTKAQNGLPFDIVFAVFFPAVTGFTAGVAMSGDLKNPKKSIPTGTLAAIGIGLIIYLSLAILFGFFVNRNLLINDYNFLLKIAWFSPFVMAGIWGATLSSALGGILGAPRILQAISIDKITPKILGKGFGKNNEPRNALILTFAIAEAGVLIGELNIIARLVTMFYIAAYGFINISFALEKWAGTDFRPTFKIPNWIGILGFLACFIVMLRLDFIAMLVAIVVLAGLYFIVKKKKFHHDFGDVWQSVWQTIIRSVLKKMDKQVLEEKNWRPNIILFSGGTKARPYLVELGKCFIGKQGFLSNFDLIERSSSKTTITKKHQTSFSDETDRYHGVFARRQEVDNIYEGIENISSSYGFSGVEPNTIMMGWAANSKNPVKFVNLIKRLSDLDFNILLVDYDKERKFGDKDQIDIWVRGGGNNGSLVLTLMKFLWLSADWNNARIRLLTVNYIKAERDKIYKALNNLLNLYRINAEIKIVNNEIEQRPVYQIIQTESGNADLVFLGMPEVKEGKEEYFIQNTSKLLLNLGSVILVNASSYFKKLEITSSAELKDISTPSLLFADNRFTQDSLTKQKIFKSNKDTSEILLPENKLIADPLQKIYNEGNSLIDELINNYFKDYFDYQNQTIKSVEKDLFNTLKTLKIKIENDLLTEPQTSIIRYNRNLLNQISKIISTRNDNEFVNQKIVLTNLIEYFESELEQIINNIPEEIVLSEKEIVKSSQADQKKHKNIKFQYRKYLGNYLQNNLHNKFYRFISDFGISMVDFQIKLQNLNHLITDSFYRIELQDNRVEQITSAEIKTKNYIDNLYQFNNNTISAIRTKITEDLTAIINSISNFYNEESYHDFIKTLKADKITPEEKKINEVPKYWIRNQNLLNNAIYLELTISSFDAKLHEIVNKANTNLYNKINSDFIETLENKIKYLGTFKEGFKEDIDQKFDYDQIQSPSDDFKYYIKDISDNMFNDVKSAIEIFPEKIEVFHSDDYNNFDSIQFKTIRKNIISASKKIDFITQGELIEPLENHLSLLPEKLYKSINVTQQALKEIAFNLEEEIDNRDKDMKSYQENILSQINNQKNIIDSEKKKLEKVRNQTKNHIKELYSSLANKISFNTFITAGKDYKIYIKQQDKKVKTGLSEKYSEAIRNYTNKIADKYWHSQQKDLPLLPDPQSLAIQKKTDISKIRDFVDSVSVDNKILEKIPYYYKQLFLRKQYYLNEFWSGRDDELNQFNKAIERHNKGIDGAIIVCGNQNQGKTFFVNYAVKKFMKDHEVINITPPQQSTTDWKLFKSKLEKATNIRGSVYTIFRYLHEKSILFIDNAELWWQRSDNGLEVLDNLIEIIENYSKKILIILGFDTNTYNFINRIKNIDQYFIQKVELNPLSEVELRDIIQKRHNSGNIDVRIVNQPDKPISIWKWSAMSSTYSTISRGNPGSALYSWISNLVGYSDNTLIANKPQIHDHLILGYLPDEWNIVLLQILLHRRISGNRLSEILTNNNSEINSTLNSIKRAGLIIERYYNIYEINFTVYTYLIDIFKQKEII